jgi:phage terminase large subunit-like protein
MTLAAEPVSIPELAKQLAGLSAEERDKILEQLPDEVVLDLLYDWDIWARDKQRLPEGSWYVWLILSGRGFGKTRIGAETCRKWVTRAAERRRPIRLALIAETAADARDVLVEGESGILRISHPDFMPKYEPSKRRVTWPDGSMGILFAGNEPDQLRGPQFDKAWADELAKFQYPKETWDNLEYALRLGTEPQVVVTTTPRPIPIIKGFLKDPMCIVTTGSSYENQANLAPAFIKRVIQKHEGTRLGQQEIHAKILDDIQGALWTYKMFEDNRAKLPLMEDWLRVVVGVDPSVSATKKSDEVGIVVAMMGYDPILNKKFGYVVKDASAVMTPLEWAKVTVKVFKDWHGDRIVAEKNNGGDLVDVNIRTVDQNVPIKLVSASRGKHVRAEPIAALYEQGLIKHCGQFPELEEQLTNFNREGYAGDDSPDRADALIWSLTELMLGPGGEYDPDKWQVVQR